MENEFADWGLPESVLRAFEAEEVDVAAALVLGEVALSNLLKEGPKARFLSAREKYLEKNTVVLDLNSTDVAGSSFQVNDTPRSLSHSPQISVVLEASPAKATSNVEITAVPQPTSVSGSRPSCSQSNPSKKRKICTTYVNQIDTLLDDCLEGQSVLASYRKKSHLDNASRDQLVKCVIFSLFRNDYDIRVIPSKLESIAKDIHEVFRTESALTYFSRHQKNGKQVVAGRLVVKYHNLRRKLISVGLIPKTTLQEELEIEEEIVHTEVDLEEDEDLRWLSGNSRPWADVLSAWDRTHIARMQLVRCINKSQKPTEGEPMENVITSVSSYLSYFRALGTVHGWELLLEDFNQLHPGKAVALTSNWPKLEALAKIRLGSQVKFLDDGSLSFDQKVTELLIRLNQLFKVRNVSTPKGSWKVSRIEAQRSFVLHAPTEGSWKSVINDRRECLAKQGLSLQPYLCFIGPVHQIKNWKLVFNDKSSWDFESPLQALDVAFKSFFATDAAYPAESRHIWTFIQQAVYGIVCANDFKDDKPLKAYLASDLKQFAAI
ncbi:uncharacterized protein LOC113215430 [Frankliniella occidentalis]|uniref:Uncharacterized protein LOC113215430 n=1 Tax=Frankliniella occidentalis TaxID=133901 RepID=A0A6J1TGI4_FRAOC|nr:uncharacterized protein LOC113215430 [Frankliniella occidentalis]